MAHNMRPATTVSFIAQIFIFGRSFQCAYRKTKPSRLLPNAKDGTELCKSGQNNLTMPHRSRAGGANITKGNGLQLDFLVSRNLPDLHLDSRRLELIYHLEIGVARKHRWRKSMYRLFARLSASDIYMGYRIKTLSEPISILNALNNDEQPIFIGYAT